MKNKIYVDITSTLQAPYVSGIQRVVTNISKVLESLGGDEIVFIKFNSKCYVKAELNFRAHYELPLLIKTVNLPVIRRIKGLIPQAIKNKIIELLIKFKKNNFSIKNNIQNEIEIIKGDKLILLDATWNYSPWQKIRQYKESGAIVGQVIYDLLPIEMPENFTNILAKKFSLWFQMIQYYCDEFYCISNSVKQNLISRIDDKNKKVEVMRLGDDLIGENVEEPQNSNTINGLSFLTVGTIEPRKNHLFLLNAFDRIWRENKELEIHWSVFGRIGWKSDAFVDILKYHPELGKRLHLFINKDDVVLNKIYKESNCVVQGSKDEGYGLPIVEAIKNNKSVLVSDIPVFREFNLPNECYFDINSIDNLMEKILKFDPDNKNYDEAKISKLSWYEAGKLFYDQIKLH